MHRRLLAGLALLLTVSPFFAAQAEQKEPVILSAARSAQSKNPETASPSTTAQTFSTTDSPSQAAPPPGIATLLARVRAHNLALEALRKHYICTITQVADDFSSDGSKKTHTDQYQAFYVGNTEIQQHIARDGKPLSPEDAKKEQQRVDELTAKLKTHPPKPDKNSVNLSASGLLKVATFTNPRREQIDGRPTLVFDYKGNPDAKANDLGDQIMRDLAGTLWVDERDSAILRLTGALQKNFHVAGGLLINIKKGSWFDFTQMRVNNEIWFMKTLAVHVDGRFLVFKGFNGDAHRVFSDYRKLTTTVTLLPGSHVVDETNPPSPDPQSQPQTAAPPPQTIHPSTTPQSW
jgi:hypothetical protein